MYARSSGRVAVPSATADGGGTPSLPGAVPACARFATKKMVFAFALAVSVLSADVVIDRSSEVVVREDAPSATRLAAEELNFFLKGVLGAPLPVVAQRTAGKTAIVLGADGGSPGRLAPPCWHAGRVPLLGEPVGSRVPRDRDAYIIEACSTVVRIVGNDDAPSDPAATAALPDEAPWQPCFRRGTLFGVYAFLERFAGVRMYFPGELGMCFGAGAARSCASDSEKRHPCRFISVPEGRIEESPAFSVRRYGYADGPVTADLLAGMDETAFKRLNWYRLRMETFHLRCCHGAKTHCLAPETWDAIYTNACAILAAAVAERPPYQCAGRGTRPACPRSRGTRDPTNPQRAFRHAHERRQIHHDGNALRAKHDSPNHGW